MSRCYVLADNIYHHTTNIICLEESELNFQEVYEQQHFYVLQNPAFTFLLIFFLFVFCSFVGIMCFVIDVLVIDFTFCCKLCVYLTLQLTFRLLDINMSMNKVQTLNLVQRKYIYTECVHIA